MYLSFALLSFSIPYFIGLGSVSVACFCCSQTKFFIVKVTSVWGFFSIVFCMVHNDLIFLLVISRCLIVYQLLLSCFAAVSLEISLLSCGV